MKKNKCKFMILRCFALFFVLSLVAPFAADAKERKHKYYLSAALIFRDEAPYLKEWIEYHAMLGVEHFYVYNNLSKDNYREVLDPYVKQGLVELIEWPYEQGPKLCWPKIQHDSYTDAVNRAKKMSKWLAIIDADEFMVPNSHESLDAMLRSLEKEDSKNEIASYFLQWIVFGTSNVESIPKDKLMIEMLTHHDPEPNRLMKCIVQPAHVKKVYNAHRCTLKGHKKKQGISLDIGQINHYMYRDEHYMKTVKIPRLIQRGEGLEELLLDKDVANSDQRYSGTIARFVTQLRARMGL